MNRIARGVGPVRKMSTGVGVREASGSFRISADMTKPSGPIEQGTVLSADIIGPLAPVRILHPPGTFVLTPASLVALSAVGRHHGQLEGVGLDWGSGTGCLAIVAARAPRVRRVVGLEISEPDVRIAVENARLNAVGDKVSFVLADSYEPRTAEGGQILAELRGRLDFIIANPPSSEGDDGFSFRRAVLDGAREFLTDGGRVFLSISLQYGEERIAALVADMPEFSHRGVLASSGWVPFDLSRPDLLHCLELYAAEENRGGRPYTFRAAKGTGLQDARQALRDYRRTGSNPYSKWQSRLFVYAVGTRTAHLRA